MTSIRERIAAKQRKRVTVPIQISDSTEDQTIRMGAATAWEQARTRDEVDETEVADLQRQMEEAWAKVEAHTESVVLVALPDVDWEAATAEYVTDDGDSLDWPRALPHLLALSCEDEDLRDADWWAATLAGEAWTAGEKDQLRVALLHLNVRAPDLRVPKD